MVDLIGIHARWGAVGGFGTIADRFAASLGTGCRHPASHHVAGDVLLASTSRARRWTPVAAPDGRRVLFSGFIANRRAIARALDCDAGDDAVLYARGLALWGDAVDLMLMGEFATIVHDQAERTIRLARSPIVAPPIHYWRGSGQFIAASTPRALFATGEVPRELDEQKIADSLYLNYCEGERSWFRHVSRLPAGARLRVTPDGLAVDHYYDLFQVPPVRLPRDEDYVEAADALMSEAVQAMLDGFDRPAISLSGGFDSQAVAAYTVAARPGRPLLGLTSVPETGWQETPGRRRFGDERAHVQALAALYPELTTHWIDAAGCGIDHKLNEMFLLGSISPRNIGNLHWIHEAYAFARQSGCDVVLGGAMGNATFSFSGDGALPDWLRRGALRPLARELWHGGARAAAPRRFVSQALMPHFPAGLWQRIRSMRGHAALDPLESWSPIGHGYAAEMRVAERARDMGYDPLFRPVRSTREWRSAMLAGPIHEAGDVLMAMTLMHGIEHRDPTGYRPLLEFCAAIPDDQYLRRGEKRWLARRMLKGKVPDMVLNETRRGEQAADWHLRMTRQRDSFIAEVDRLAENPAMARRLDLAGLRLILDQWPETPPDDQKQTARIRLALTRALGTARFIQFVEGGNR